MFMELEDSTLIYLSTLVPFARGLIFHNELEYDFMLLRTGFLAIICHGKIDPIKFVDIVRSPLIRS